MPGGPVVQLVRHAESANNVIYNVLVNRFGGPDAVAGDPALQARIEAEELRQRTPDPALSERGFEQARRLGVAAALSGLTSTSSFDSTLVVVSPMRRACLTAAPLVEGLRQHGCKVTVTCLGQYFETGGCYREAQALPGRTHAEVCAEHPSLDLGAAVYYDAGGWFAYSSRVEDRAAIRARVERVYLWLTGVLSAASDASRVILVGHGNFMSHLLLRCLGLDPHGASAKVVTPNTGVSTLQFIRARCGFLLHALADTRHLPNDLVTGRDAVVDGWGAAIIVPDLALERHAGYASIPSAEIRAAALAMRREGLWALESGVDAATYAESDERCVTFLVLQPGLRLALVGHCQYEPETQRLRQLFVLPQFRGLGAGRKLVEAVDSEHRRAAAAAAVAGGTPPPPPPPPLRVHAHLSSAAFYAALGFERAGEVYVSNGVECVAMTRVCNP